MAPPIVTLGTMLVPSQSIGVCIAARDGPGDAAQLSGLVAVGQQYGEFVAPILKAVPSEAAEARRRPTASISRSPTAWPIVSLTALR